MPSNFDSVTVQACVQGFVSAVGHHYVRQGSAEVRRYGAVTTLQYGNEIEYTWSRSFRFKLELLDEEGATAAEIDQIYRYVAVDPRAECVVNLLVTDPGALMEELKPRGFTHAFDKALMARSVELPPCNAQAVRLQLARRDKRRTDAIGSIRRSAGPWLVRRLSQLYRKRTSSRTQSAMLPALRLMSAVWGRVPASSLG